MRPQPSLRPDVRVDLLRQIEKQLAEQDEPDVELLGRVRELLMEAEVELER